MTTATIGEIRMVGDPPTSRFVWKIANFSRLSTKKYYSEVFTVGECKWRVLLFPKGDNVDRSSMHLDVADLESLATGWSRHAQFSLSIVNQMHGKNTLMKSKTMVARLLGKVLHKLGLLSIDKVTEVQRTDLVGEYIGHTGVKTRLKIEEASGGILFVDEAYRLVPLNSPRDFGVEALEEIMSAMDSGDIIAIFAGYSEEMERVISANAGFSRRVSKFFYFDDYTPSDIATILHLKINAQKEDTFIYGFKLHPDCTIEAIASLIEENIPDEQLKKLNGGLVDPLLINSLENLDLRMDVDCMDLDTLITITMEDLEEGLKSTASSKKKGP